MEQRTLKIGDRVIYCYEDGSVEYFSNANMHRLKPLVRSFGYDDSKGYKVIRITINGKLANLWIHRIMALAFHPNPEGLPEVDHINRDKTDNRSCNLRWVDRKTNNDNKDSVDQSIMKYGTRYCENPKAYDKARRKVILTMIKPGGGSTNTKALSPEVYDLLKPLSQKERYFKYQEIQNA